MTEIGRFTPTASGTGDMWLPKDHPNVPVIVKVRAVRSGVVTSNSPEGTDALLVDLVDLSTSEVLRDVLWFGGAVLDNLTEHVGGLALVIKFAPRKSKAGRDYVAPEEGSDAEIAYARQWLAAKGDPFVAPLATLNPVPAPAPVALPAIAPMPVTLPTLAPSPVVEAVPGPAPIVVPGSVYQAMVNAHLDVSNYVVG